MSDIQYCHKGLKTTAQPQINLADIPQQVTGENVTVCGKVVQEFEIQLLKTKSGRELPLKDVILADATASVKLALWAHNIDQVSLTSSYLCKNVSIKDFDGKKFISSTPNTIIQPCDDIGIVKADDSYLPITITETPTSVTVTITTSCNNCHSTLTITPQQQQAKTIKCPQCGMRRLRSNVKRSITAKMQLPGAQHPTLMFTSAVLGPCLESTTNLDIEDTDTVEEYFLTSKLQITLMENTAYPLTLIVLSADE